MSEDRKTRTYIFTIMKSTIKFFETWKIPWIFNDSIVFYMRPKLSSRTGQIEGSGNPRHYAILTINNGIRSLAGDNRHNTQ